MLRYNFGLMLVPSLLIPFGDEPPAGTPPPAAKPPATFTQEQLNTFLADERRKAEQKQKELLTKVESLELTAKQKEALESQLEELRTQGLSEQEKIKSALTKKEKDFEKQIKQVTQERDDHVKKYSDLRINHELSRAASEQKAKHAWQIVEYLAPRTRLAPVLNEGKPTGEYEPRVKIELTKEGKLVPFDMTPADALKAMKEDAERYGNFFENSQVPGTGTTPGSGSKQTSGKTSIKDMSQAEIKKFMQDNPALFGR